MLEETWWVLGRTEVWVQVDPKRSIFTYGSSWNYFIYRKYYMYSALLFIMLKLSKEYLEFKKSTKNTEMQDKYAKETEEIDIERWVFFWAGGTWLSRNAPSDGSPLKGTYQWYTSQYMDRYIYCGPLSLSGRVGQTNLEFAHLWFPQDGWFALVIVEMVNAAMLQAILETYVKIPLRKLTWQWEIHHLKMSC